MDRILVDQTHANKQSRRVGLSFLISAGTHRSSIPAPIQETADAQAIPTSVTLQSLYEYVVSSGCKSCTGYHHLPRSICGNISEL